jgi:hypothetical protein
MKYWLLIISFLLIGCGQEKESCTDVMANIQLIEESTIIHQDKLSELKESLANEKNDEWKKTIAKTLELTKKKIANNNERVREMHRKNQRCYSS